MKYKTKAIDFYRRVLEAEASQKEFTGDLPTLDEGRRLLDGRKINAVGQIEDEPSEITIVPVVKSEPENPTVEICE